MKKLLVGLSALALMTGTAFAAKPGSGVATVPGSVCIDAGHGGADSGAVYQGIVEKELNLEVAVLLRDKLQAEGRTVFMTRLDNDVTLSNSDRYTFCNSKGAALLISVHHNGSTDHSVNYTTALYGKRADIAIANLVNDNVSAALGLEKRAVSRFASGVLLKSKMPATISEAFFVSSDEEVQRLTTDRTGRLSAEADGLKSAVDAYFAAQ